MITTTKKIKIDYAPLNVVLEMVLQTPTAGLIQTYNVASSEYEPDRSLAAQQTVIYPKVQVSASDNSIGLLLNNASGKGYAVANSILKNVVWLLNGSSIANSTLEYSISQSGDNNGRLILKSNIPVGTTYTLQFKATLLDARKNVAIPVESELMYLTCTTKAENVLSVEVCRQHVAYDIMHDKLAEYDYKVCRGIISDSDTVRNTCLDGNEYLVSLPYIIKYGDEDVTGDKTVKLQKYNDETQSWETVNITSQDNPEIQSFEIAARGNIVIDCRLISGLNRYRLYVTITTNDRTFEDYDEFTIKHTPSSYQLQIRNDSGLNINRRIRHEDVIVSCDNLIKDYPAAYLNIEWGNNRFSKKANCGSEGLIDTWRSDNNITDPITSESDTLEVSVSHEPKGQYALLTNGTTLIKNQTGTVFLIDT